MNAPSTRPRAGRREWIGLAVLALPCLLYAMDMTVLNLAVPHISAALRPTSAELLWIVDIYGFMIAGSLITMGTLGDRIGRRKLLLVGAAAFGLASILAALSTTPAMLIGARALLGLAAATLAPSTLSLLRSMFHDEQQRRFAVGVWIASFSTGAAIGPIIGGVLLASFWWGSVFLIAVPVMVLLLAAGPFLLPEFRDPEAGRMDIPSAALSLASILAVIYGIKRAAEAGLTAVTLGTIALGLLAAAVFLIRQVRLADPLIDLGMFRRPAFSAALLVNLLAFFIAFGSFLFIAQFLQLVLGLSPFEAGLWSLPSALAFVAGSMLTPAAAGRIRPPLLMAGGLALAALGFGGVTLAVTMGDLAVMVAAYAVFSLGLAPVFTLTTDLVVGTVTPERAGAASAIAETSSELGGALGIALLGSLVTAVYRADLARRAPRDLPEQLAVTAHDTLGGALTVVAGLPADLGQMLAAAARLAFSQGLFLAAAACTGLSLATALLVLLMLRGAGRTPGGDDARAVPAE